MDTEQATITSDRDPSGRFVKGCKTGGARPGAGRKPGDSQKELLLAVVTREDWEAIFAAQLEKAKQGDLKAAIFLADRRWGKPAQSIEVRGEDTAPILGLTFVAPPRLHEVE